jgi:hypothetical protein
VVTEPGYDPVIQAERIALVDLLDRVLAGGVVIVGDITLSIADVDLVTVSLRALVTSVSALMDTMDDSQELQLMTDGVGTTDQRNAVHRLRIDADPESVEKGLVTLVLTLVELLRQLMERQALRRVEQGSLTDDQIEKVGSTLMALDARMAELRDHFGLTIEDLNLDLGPLGPLLPREGR